MVFVLNATVSPFQPYYSFMRASTIPVNVTDKAYVYRTFTI